MGFFMNKSSNSIGESIPGNITDASTTQKGIVQLNNTLTSDSVTQAVTAAKAKELNDKLNTLSEEVTVHGTSDAPHTYGGKFELRYNPTTNSLDLVVLE